VAHREDAPPRTDSLNTGQGVAANGRRVQDVPPWPRASCTTAQAKAVANGGRSSTHDSQSNKPGRCCQRQMCAEGCRTFPGGHDLRSPRRRQRRWRTEKTYFHEPSIETLARTLLPTGEGYRTFPGGHDLRAPRRRQRRWRTEKTYFHESSIDTLARTLLPTGEGYRTFPGGHDLRAPRRRQGRWRTEDAAPRTAEHSQFRTAMQTPFRIVSGKTRGPET
jgi:hypothetical protein